MTEPLYTKKCIVCNRDAVVWGGHVHAENGVVVAGKCPNHKDVVSPLEDQCQGCFGDRVNLELKKL